MTARILILEDDPDQSLLMSDILTASGYQVVVAISVDEAEQILDEETINLAILDMNLPGRPGTEALAYIRNQPTTTGMPVIVVTAQPGFSSAVEELGTDLFLVKPIDIATLRTLVQRCLIDQNL